MTVKSNIHTHTTYCDGGATVKEMIAQAIKLNYRSLGFSGHAFMNFDQSYCMTKEGTQDYIREVRAEAEANADKLEILCGIEQDCFSNEPTDAYDYVLGACHYVYKDGVHLPVDESQKVMEQGVKELFGNDYMAYTRQYFHHMAELADNMKPDVIVHFDLVTKFNEGGRFFDESRKEYQYPALEALEALAKKCEIFEINTGAIFRNCRTVPYPAPFLLKAMKDMGLRIILGSDSHAVPSLGFAFDQAAELARSVGYRSAVILTKKGFEEVAL